MARAGRLSAAVQNILNGKVDILAFGASLNLDTVGQRGHSGMSPAGAAIVGQMLVEGLGKVGDSVYVAPVPLSGKVAGIEILVRLSGQ